MALLDGKVAIITGSVEGHRPRAEPALRAGEAAVVCAARSADLVRETAEAGVQGRRARHRRHVRRREGRRRRADDRGRGQGLRQITTLINNAATAGPTKRCRTTRWTTGCTRSTRA